MVSDCKHPTVIAGVKCLQCEIERLKERIKELEYQLAVSRGNFSQERNLFKAEANSLTAERIKCEQQNAKLVKALEKIASCLPWHDEENAKVCVEIAKAVLKEARGE